jgi:hypothetical protein
MAQLGQNLLMPDAVVMTTIISTAGTLCGALGGIGLSNGMSARREDRKEDRRRADERIAAQRDAYAGLLSTAAQMRVHIEMTCRRYWKDMGVRLTSIQEHAVSVGLQASRAALLSPAPVADAALSVGLAASNLSSWAVENVDLGDFSGPDNQFLPGEMRSHPDLGEFDVATATFFRLAANILG